MFNCMNEHWRTTSANLNHQPSISLHIHPLFFFYNKAFKFTCGASHLLGPKTKVVQNVGALLPALLISAITSKRVNIPSIRVSKRRILHRPRGFKIREEDNRGKKQHFNRRRATNMTGKTLQDRMGNKAGDSN